MRTWLPIVVWLLACIAHAEDEAPSTAVHDEYRQTMERGIVEYDAGRWVEARALFWRAHELWPSSRTWRVLGKTSFELRTYPRAVEELAAALSDSRRPLDAKLRAEAEDLLGQARQFVGRFQFQLQPPEAQLELDGEPAALAPDGSLVLGVGEHDLRFRAVGFAPRRLTLHVQGREDVVRTVALEPVQVAVVQAPLLAVPPRRDDPPVRWMRPTAYASAGVAVAGLVVGAVLGGLTIQREGRLDDACPGKVCAPSRQDDIEQARRFGNASTAMLALGVSAGVLATVLWLRARATERPQARLDRVVF